MFKTLHLNVQIFFSSIYCLITKICVNEAQPYSWLLNMILNRCRVIFLVESVRSNNYTL